MRLLIILAAVASTDGFAYSSYRQSSGSSEFPISTKRRKQHTLLFSSASSDSSFMSSLNSRIQQVKEDRLPLLVLDTMLPRQVLTLQIENGALFQLLHERMVNETPFVGITGLAQLKTGQSVYLKFGVEAEITGLCTSNDSSSNSNGQGEQKQSDTAVTVEFTARRRFKIVEDSIRNVNTWTEAEVDYITDVDDESSLTENDAKLSLAHAIWKAKELDELVNTWIALARQNEQHEHQIDRLLAQLGGMPPSIAPTDRALWVGALINPIPAMRVAHEIRPSLLTASSALDRIEIVVEGITTSIRYMQEKGKAQQSD